MRTHELHREGGPLAPDERPDVEPGTIVVYSDLSCAFAHLCVYRLHAARARLGADVRFVHRHFVLEEVNRFPIPKHFLDSEVPAIAPLDPDAGWRVYTGLPERWPVSTVLAMEAVRAAEEQSPEAHEQLDRALRMAFFRDHECITMRHVILDIAGRCDAVDADRLADAIDDGRFRGPLIEDHRAALRFVDGSPQLFLPDGSTFHNPGVAVDWTAPQGDGYPVVRWTDPDIHESVIRRSAR